MSNKIPCGGFYLDDMLNVNESGELSINGGTPYQQLVTDGDGKATWEDRLAYDDSKLVVNISSAVKYVKVADEVPSWATVDAIIKFWVSNGTNDTSTSEDRLDLGNGSFMVGDFAFIIATDNVEFNGHVFPEKGVYFMSVSDNLYATGIASADSDTPEITWDGNIETIKTIDPKYIPNELNEIILPSSTSGSSKKFKITVDDTGTITATEYTT